MFDANYMRKRNYLAWRAPIVCAVIKKILNPRYILDLGCATGDLVNEFFRQGVLAWGVDSSEDAIKAAVTDRITLADMTDSRFWETLNHSKIDLITCFEVFRFIEEDDMPDLIHNITGNAEKFLFGYIGNKLPLIETHLYAHNFNRMPEIEYYLQAELAPWKSKPAIKAIYNGSQYWVRNER